MTLAYHQHTAYPLEVPSLPTPLLSFPASPLPATTTRQTPGALGKGLWSNFKTLCMHLPTPGPLFSIPGSQFRRMLTAHAGQQLYFQRVTRAPNTLTRLELCSITCSAQLLRKHSDKTVADSVRKALEGRKVVTLHTTTPGPTCCSFPAPYADSSPGATLHTLASSFLCPWNNGLCTEPVSTGARPQVFHHCIVCHSVAGPHGCRCQATELWLISCY